VHPFNIVADIEYDAGKNVHDKRETDRQKRGVDKKQPYFGDRHVKFFAKVGTYPERISFKKGNYALQLITHTSKSYFPRCTAGIFYRRSNYSSPQAAPAIQTHSLF
jgi:hypothetical protein